MPPSQATELETPSPSPLPPPRPHRPLFGFGEPATPADLPSSQHPSHDPSQTEEELLEELEQDLEDDDYAPDPSPPAPGTPSAGVANPLNGDGLRDMFRGGVILAGEQAHNLLAKTEGQKLAGLYKADEQDAAGIGDPLARIAGRHQGIGKVSPDTADLLSAMVSLTRYATRQMVARNEAQAFDNGITPATVDL